MSISLGFDNNTTGDAAWTTVPTIARTTEGGSVSAGVVGGLLDPSTFLQTQIAKDSLIRVDDYPP